MLTDFPQIFLFCFSEASVFVYHFCDFLFLPCYKLILGGWGWEGERGDRGRHREEERRENQAHLNECLAKVTSAVACSQEECPSRL